MRRLFVALVLAGCSLGLVVAPALADEGDQPSVGSAQWIGAVASGDDDKPGRSGATPEQLPGKPGAAPGQLPGGGWITHVDRQNGFSIAVPADWEIIDFTALAPGQDDPLAGEFGQLISFAATDPTGLTSANLIVIPVEPGTTLADLEEDPSDLLAGIQDIGTNVEIGRVRLPAGESLAIAYDLNQPTAGQSDTFRILQFLLIQNDSAYIITLGSSADPQQIEPLLERIAASFRFV